MKLSRLFVPFLLALGMSSAMASTYDASTGTGAVWAKGVSITTGWHDANKDDPYNGDTDDLLCYAAAASNLIAWWQNSNYAKNLDSSDAPEKIDSIWQTYLESNLAYEGGDTASALNWWISGVYAPGNTPASANPELPATPPGPDHPITDADTPSPWVYVDSVDPTHPDWERYFGEKLKEDLPVSFSNFKGYYYDQYGLTQQNLSNFIFDAWIYGAWSKDGAAEIDFRKLLDSGACIALAICADSTALGHAITLWGVEYKNGVLTKLYLTDSDDAYVNPEPTLFGATVEIGADGKIYIVGTELDTETELYYGSRDVYIDTVFALMGRESLKWSLANTAAYVNLQVNPSSHNGHAGAALLPEVIMNAAPAEGGVLAGIFEAVDAGKVDDRGAAAVAGASTAVLGQALSADMERQLRAIRNRAAMGYYSRDVVVTDGKGGSLEQPGKYFAWVNAEGNRAEQDADSTAAGYTLSSWGGTLGAGMQVNPQLTLGLALTAMYGDLQSEGPDSLDGDMDTAYLSAFARYRSSSLSHSVICSFATMEADYKRAALSYSNSGETEGTALGLMYELSREYALDARSSISPLVQVSYRHTSVDAYSEHGTDAALSVGKQRLDTVTLALGARYAAVVGQQILNRACDFEARALVKYDFGDTQTGTSVGFVNYATRSNIESAERGAAGLELGAGIAVPAGPSSIFADGSVELRSDYTNFNATVGYRMQF